MPRKQATVNESSAAAAPARAAKPKAPRVQSAKHTKAAASEPAAVTEKNPPVEVSPATAVDSAAIASAIQAQLPVEQIETSLFTSASAADTASSAPAANGDPREEIARIAYGYWVTRGYVAGDPLEDWVRAENEYRQRLGR